MIGDEGGVIEVRMYARVNPGLDETTSSPGIPDPPTGAFLG